MRNLLTNLCSRGRKAFCSRARKMAARGLPTHSERIHGSSVRSEGENIFLGSRLNADLMTKYRVVVNAAQTWKSSFGDECGGVAERGVHLDALNTADAVRKAEGVMSAIYPEANRFDSY